MTDLPDNALPSPARRRLRAAFLVRCWFEDEAWRYSLESITTRRQRYYLTLEALLDGLMGELDGDGADDTDG